MNDAAYRAILQRLGVEPPTPARGDDHGGGAPGTAPTAPPRADRVAVFRAQLADWITSGRLGVPVLALPGVDAARQPDEPGCLSCAGPLPADRIRCDPCRRAVELALRLTSPAPDSPRG